MQKTFEDVFPTLHLQDSEKVSALDVEKVCTNKLHSYLKIVIVAHEWIPRKTWLYLQSEIKEQLFLDCSIDICIHDKYELNKKYSMAELFQLFESNVREELKEKDMLLYLVFSQASYHFKQETMYLQLEDGFLEREKEKEIIAYLKAFLKRNFS